MGSSPPGVLTPPFIAAGFKQVKMSEETKNSPITILKGSSSNSLKPFVSLVIPESDHTLEDLRKTLGRFKYISSTEAFLTSDLFPIHKEDETIIQWKDLLVDNTKAPSGKGSTSSNKKKTQNQSTSKHIRIVSRPSDRRSAPEVSLPDLPNFNSPSDHPKPPPPQELKIPKASRSEITVNAKTLEKEQLDELVCSSSS